MVSWRTSPGGKEMKQKFTGHDTFPLRYGWPYKAVNLLFSEDNIKKSSDEQAKDAIVELGVGRNMVNAIKYWAEMTGVLESVPGSARNIPRITLFGRFLFNVNAGEQSAVDPYLEDIGSIWLLHFHLNFDNRALTSYRYFFNYSNFQSFEKNKLVDEIESECLTLTGAESGKKSTIKKDVDCFLHTYTKKHKLARSVDEDYFASPLSELGLIREVSNGYFVSELSERHTLPSLIFGYALCKFVERENQYSQATSIDFDSILAKPGSPGRIFRMSEAGLSRALDELSKISRGNISWTDSRGLRQITISERYMADIEENLLEKYYGGVCAYNF